LCAVESLAFLETGWIGMETGWTAWKELAKSLAEIDGFGPQK